MTREQALATLSRLVGPRLQEKTKQEAIVPFAEEHFYIAETDSPIQITSHQRVILEYIFDPNHSFQQGGTAIYSCPKKSGKTAIAAVMGRWGAETWGRANEVYCMANDYEQARGRIYDQILKSIELDPQYIKQRQTSSLGWKIIERQALYEPNGSTIKSLSGDYRGEAGSNPTMTLWSELWGFQSEASRRLWEELTPVPTRRRALRVVETYAGYEDSSDLLLDLYTLGLQGRRLTHDDLDWPFPDQPPIWVNERANLFMYWDSGPVAHRMPWQTPQYYQGQAAIMRDEAYRRLHLNEWVSSANSFIPEEWWTRLRHPLPPLDANTPVVLGVDASVSGDCTAITGVTRDPRNPRDVLLRFYDVWHPTPGSPINLALVDARLRHYFSQYNIVEVAYDQYQLHKLMMDIRQDGLAWVKPFSQNTLREVADKQLFDLIRDRRLGHNTGNDFDTQVKNAAAKQNVGDVDKLRIIKRGKDNHIDLVVALAMAAYECLRLNL